MSKRFVLALVFCVSVACLIVGLRASARNDQGGSTAVRKAVGGRMSSTGKFARRHSKAVSAGLEARVLANLRDLLGAKPTDKAGCIEEEDCGEEQGLDEGPHSTQSEVSIAIDRTGRHVVIGFNDFRGFDNGSNPTSLSGFMYSDDGGATFVDGGQLPTPGNDVIGTTRFPQVFGDPDIDYLGACNFVYSSIIVKKFSATTAAQTLGIHRSTDCGHTWTGPFEVTAATNPNGLTDAAGNPLDAADKEFMSFDPDSGRVLMSWSNFTPAAPGGVEISATYSDNVLTATPPTWSPHAVVGNDEQDGQSSAPAFAGNGSLNAYIVWSRFPAFGFIHKVAFARSTNNGATWSAPTELSPVFAATDQILGNDRVNTSPSIAVDTSRGPHKGNVYVVYGNNNTFDGADIVFQRSLDNGVTFSAPIYLNSRPGNDRAQWFPWVAVDSSTGRVNVFYYDQEVATSGDLSEVSWLFSNDGGLSWSKPMPLTKRPFHAGYGNDTGQPNLGDYNQAVARHNELFAAYAATQPVGFADGQPGVRFTVPDVFFSRDPRHGISLRLTSITVSDGDGSSRFDDDREASERHDDDEEGDSRGGRGDGGSLKLLKIPLFNYVTNPLSASRVREVEGRLSTTTPGVRVLVAEREYGSIAPGVTKTHGGSYVLRLSRDFVSGTPIELVLRVVSEGGSTELLDTIATGTRQPTTILSENFDGVPPGTLPAGWAAVHVTRANGTPNNVPWTTSNTFCGTTSNAAFHVNANDTTPPAPNQARFERLFSPNFVVPAVSSFVTLDMDVCTNTEDEPFFNIQAYDGLVLRITDLTTGRVLRSNLAEAFASVIRTGSIFHYPKHFPRFQSAVYLEDMSAWAGDSQGFQHVHMELPGMGGSTAQLRFEYTQDSTADCTFVRPGTSCGVMVDNVVLQNVVLGGRP
jgi:hypothetical protein